MGQTSNLVHGIYIAAHDWTVSNNTVYAIAGTGITSWHDSTHLTITHNTVDNAYQGITIGAGESRP